MEEIKGRYFMITKTYIDASRWNNDLIIINSACSRVAKASGILVLFVCVFPFVSKLTNKTNWSKSDLSILRRCKPNIIKKNGSNHFDSRGYIYSFGNKAYYGKIHESSISSYTTKKSGDIEKQKNIVDMSHNIELKCAVEIKDGVSQLSQILPNIRKLISPALRVAYDMQNSLGDINFNCVTTSEVRMWQLKVCVNAST